MATRNEHLRLLRMLQFQLGEMNLWDCPLPDAIEYCMLKLSQRGTRSPWHPATLARYLASIHGAFVDLPLYCPTTMWSIDLSQAPSYRSAMKAADAEARSASPSRNIPATTLGDLEKALQAEPNLATRVLLQLAWLTSARLGDVARIRSADITFKKEGFMSVHFVHHKTVRKRGPYTIETQVTAQWKAEIEQQMAATDSEFLFGRIEDARHLVQSATAALRRVCPEQEARSLRRGSLTALAQTAPEELVMLFSGHRSRNTLYRYLNWGKAASASAAAAAAHAQALLPAGP